MADTALSLVLDALTRAAAEPGGLPLLGGKSGAGLFAATAAGKQAAQRCKDDGLLQVLSSQAKGKSTQEICALTDKGLQLLLEQANPRLVLEAFVNALAAREHQVNDLLASAHASQEHLQVLKLSAEKVLQQLQRPAPALPRPVEKNGKHEADAASTVLAYLRHRHEGGTLDDCPLPELYRRLQSERPGLTIGQFHDLLRRLHDERAIYLHPWTGPLYELPEPVCALLAGHEIAYYASVRP